MNLKNRRWQWLFATLLPIALLTRQGNSTPQSKTKKSTHLLLLPDVRTSDMDRVTYLSSWKDTSHLWILKQRESSCELKLWNVATGKYKVVMRFNKGAYNIGPFLFFRPESFSGARGYLSGNGYAESEKHLVFVKGNHLSPIEIGPAEPLWMREQYLLQADTPGYSDSERLTVNIWDANNGFKKKSTVIKAPVGRHFSYDSSPGDDHNLRIGPILDVNVSSGIGAIATFTHFSDLGKNQFHIFKTQTGQYLRHIKLRNDTDIEKIMITPDGRKILTISGITTGRVLQLWDVRTGKMNWRYATQRQHTGAAVISSDSRKFAAGFASPTSWDERIWVWDLEAGNLQRSSPPDMYPDSLHFSPDNRYLTINNNPQYGTVSVWRIK